MNKDIKIVIFKQKLVLSALILMTVVAAFIGFYIRFNSTDLKSVELCMYITSVAAVLIPIEAVFFIYFSMKLRTVDLCIKRYSKLTDWILTLSLITVFLSAVITFNKVTVDAVVPEYAIQKIQENGHFYIKTLDKKMVCPEGIFESIRGFKSYHIRYQWNRLFPTGVKLIKLVPYKG